MTVTTVPRLSARKQALTVVLLLLAVASAACDPGARQRVTELEEQVTQLKKELDEQKQGLEKERQTLQTFMNAADAVTLKPADQGFAALWHDLGVFAIEMPLVTAIDGGSRVTLRIGNMTAGAVNNVEAKVEWGNDPEAPPVRSERKPLVRVVPFLAVHGARHAEGAAHADERPLKPPLLEDGRSRRPDRGRRRSQAPQCHRLRAPAAPEETTPRDRRVRVAG